MSLRRVALALLPLAALACSSSGGGAPSPTPAPDGGVADAGGDAAAVKLSFKPSNLDLSGVDVSGLGDYVVAEKNCALSTEAKSASCGDSSKLAFALLTQPDSSKIGVYVARSVRVEQNAELLAQGPYPLVVVALDTMEIFGTLKATPDTNGRSVGGGFPGDTTSNVKGRGPGGGGAGSETNAGAGASYCGVGGKGAPGQGGAAAAGGATYGNPEIVPLVGGSSGGSGVINGGGTGGGAIQLVAGTSLRVGPLGVVSAGGGGGLYGGAVTQQTASGGGSGGAILIESPVVEIAGLLAANGGGGGPSSTSASTEPGENGRADAQPASGGSSQLTEISFGGKGSAAAGQDGVDGSTSTESAPKGSGGGGGAGRIRINTKSGAASVTGTLSPAAATSCVSQGTLK